jgi:hypothetical protein
MHDKMEIESRATDLLQHSEFRGRNSARITSHQLL